MKNKYPNETLRFCFAGGLALGQKKKKNKYQPKPLPKYTLTFKQPKNNA
jgi:hypothetical protein